MITHLGLPHREPVPPSCLAALLPERFGFPDREGVLRRLALLGCTDEEAVPEAALPGRRPRWEIQVASGGRPGRLWLEPTRRLQSPDGVWPCWTDGEIQEAAGSRWSLVLAMPLGSRPQEALRDQASLLLQVAPEAAAVVDSSALVVHPPDWLRFLSSRRTPPGPAHLFSIQAVVPAGGPPDAGWLHTHGLLRCGMLELEVLHAAVADMPALGELIRLVAQLFVDRGVPPPGVPFQAGPKLTLAWLPWEAALELLEVQGPGAGPDRDALHRQPSGVLFATRPDSPDLEHPARYVPLLEEGGVYFVSEQETRRLARAAREHQDRFRQLFCRFCCDPAWRFQVKLSFPCGDRQEHLWFLVHRVSGRRVEATLLDQPCQARGLRRGVRRHHRLSRMTDWAIDGPLGHFTPDTLYELDRRLRQEGHGAAEE